jgi:glycosyltransferase involved in cell wall biosynthesis
MKILVVTDAWKPQVNGVVRTLERLAFEAERLGVTICFITPLDFKTIAMPGYAEIRLSLATPAMVGVKIAQENPDALHIATEGPLGLCARTWAKANHRSFTTCYHTHYPQYLAARFPIPENLTYSLLRQFHNSGAATMVATESLQSELSSRGFQRLAIWSRGVDGDLFAPRPPEQQSPLLAGHQGPIFLCVARLAVEKNLDAFLSQRMDGTKVIVGDGPDRERLEKRYPDAVFLGARFGEELASIYASADVFVFPSMSETFGLVLLEALASGLPVAAFPGRGLLGEIGAAGVGVLSGNLSEAAKAALTIPKAACRGFAMGYSHVQSTRQFLNNVSNALSVGIVQTGSVRTPMIIAADR